jgi:hypothetical protein
MDHPHVKIIRHLIRPTRGGAAGVLIVFSFLLSLASNMGIAGVVLALILTSWFFKYAYILFAHTVHGFDEPPVLDIQMLNPLSEKRPLAQVAILGLIYLTVKFARHHMGSAGASIAILGLERNILKAAYPVTRYAWC